jgi:hypothetical protein
MGTRIFALRFYPYVAIWVMQLDYSGNTASNAMNGFQQPSRRFRTIAQVLDTLPRAESKIGTISQSKDLINQKRKKSQQHQTISQASTRGLFSSMQPREHHYDLRNAGGAGGKAAEGGYQPLAATRSSRIPSSHDTENVKANLPTPW